MVGKYKLIDKLKDAFIVETEDEVFYDADISDNGTKNTFISNIEKQMKKEEIKYSCDDYGSSPSIGISFHTFKCIVINEP